ncbi:MAG: esterase [Defluviitaleaceae bacterium]|nr:esterase [Defluviitaleaceae bacterium]
MRVTSINELRTNLAGEVIELSPFDAEARFFAKLRRPSLLQLAVSGGIPNPLLGAAEQLFTGGIKGKMEFKEMAELLILVAKEALIEPSYSELSESGINLTDLQLIEIFNYTQSGVKALSEFRKIKGNTENSGD